MTDITYLFIDGGYLKRVFQETVGKIFGDQYEIDYWAIKQELRSRRAFYYDCVDNIPIEGESDADFEARVQQQEEYLDFIDSLEGFHVRRGHLSRGRTKQQKEVDVLLAVDMMSHSFNRNISKAVLISGDRDFKPVVQSIAMAGTYVEVMFWKKTGSKELGREADNVNLLDMVQLVRWAKIEESEDRNRHFPATSACNCPGGNSDYLPSIAKSLKEGTARDGKTTRTIKLSYHDSSGRYVFSVLDGKVRVLDHYFRDRSMLETFVTEQYGPITWRKDRR